MKAKHGGSFEIIERNPNVWLASCSCKAKFTGGTYELAEDKWREHVFLVSGSAPDPCGNKEIPRWSSSAIKCEGQMALL